MGRRGTCLLRQQIGRPRWRRWKVLPYRVSMGQLHLLTAEVPTEEMAVELGRLASLEIRFRLVRPHDFAELADEYLGCAG